jgi:hypothetical protein
MVTHHVALRRSLRRRIAFSPAPALTPKAECSWRCPVTINKISEPGVADSPATD